MNKDELERLVAAAEVVQQKRNDLAVAEDVLADANKYLRAAQDAYAVAYHELQGVVLGDRTPPDADEEAE